MTQARITDYTPSDRRWLVDTHGKLYARENGFDASFPALIDKILARFEAAHDPASEAGWILRDGETRLGSIFCTRPEPQLAQLRLFLLMPEARGRGLAQTMLDHCMSFASATGAARIRLMTHESHRAACRLYARNGFALRTSRPVHSYGTALIEQCWDRALFP